MSSQWLPLRFDVWCGDDCFHIEQEYRNVPRSSGDEKITIRQLVMIQFFKYIKHVEKDAQRASLHVNVHTRVMYWLCMTLPRLCMFRVRFSVWIPFGPFFLSVLQGPPATASGHLYTKNNLVIHQKTSLASPRPIRNFPKHERCTYTTTTETEQDNSNLGDMTSPTEHTHAAFWDQLSQLGSSRGG